MRNITPLGEISPPADGDPHGAPLMETARRDTGDPSTPLAAAPSTEESSLTTRNGVKSSLPLTVWAEAVCCTEPGTGGDLLCSLFHVANRCTAAL
jgi:hypothetical protein